jgi:hypothetical protein
MSERVGWFADVDNAEPPEMPGKWQPCLETGTGIIPSFDMWFDTKEACETYIREELLPIAGRMLP